MPSSTFASLPGVKSNLRGMSSVEYQVGVRDTDLILLPNSTVNIRNEPIYDLYNHNVTALMRALLIQVV
jgi:hypothetical protein